MNPLGNNVKIKIDAKGFDSFVSECKREAILLYDIVHEDNAYSCKMSFKDFRRIRRVVLISGAKVKILKKSGLGYFIRKRKKRYGFYLGGWIALIILIYLTSCIWVVDVVGNEMTSKNKILDVLDSKGIGIGKIRYGKNISDIKNASLIELDSLSWLWVTIDGTRAIIEVREKGSNEEFKNSDIPCNLVATYPGLIEDMRVRKGQKVVARKDSVAEGDLLVSGICATKYHGNRYVHSYGEIIARTWRTQSGEFSFNTQVKHITGNKEKKRRINVFGKDINLYLNKKCNFDNYIKSSSSFRTKIFGNIYLPLSFTTDEFCEIIVENVVLPEEEVIGLAVDSLTQKIESQRHKDAVTLNRTYDWEVTKEGNLYITVTVESLEDIAKPMKIELQTTEDDIIGEGY